MNSLNSVSLTNSSNVASEALRLFRVYNPFSPRTEVKIWAHSSDEADAKARAQHRALKSAASLKARIA